MFCIFVLMFFFHFTDTTINVGSYKNKTREKKEISGGKTKIKSKDKKWREEKRKINKKIVSKRRKRDLINQWNCF